MKIIVAPDSFKDCLAASEVAETIARVAEERWPDAEVIRMPVADGGEGTAALLARALGGQMRSCGVTGPLGMPVRAEYGVAGDTAIIEIAQACGLQLLKPEERNPLLTTTRGVGEMLLHARKNGCNRFLVCLGGSSTCDGGAGMLAIPGLLDAMSGTEMTILCDVDNPFTGPSGAARVFGPQKGASPADIELLEARMLRMAERIKSETGTDVTALPGAGAAGGLGGAFMACFKARKQRGIDAVLDAIGFDAALQGASLVITGEGKSDAQTLSGKAALGVLRRCQSVLRQSGNLPGRSSNVPVALISGRIEDREALQAAGFNPIIEVTPRNMPLQLALSPTIARQNLSSHMKSLFTISQGSNQKPEGAALAYEYRYSTCMQYPARYYQVKKDSDGIVKISCMKNCEPDVYEINGSEDVLERIAAITAQYKLHKLSKSYYPRMTVYDGYRWDLNISFEKGSISSGGTNADPEDKLMEGIDSINSYLQSLIDAAEK